nr:MAG TPA: hypothetical protein [Caudoviricetes sp.]
MFSNKTDQVKIQALENEKMPSDSRGILLIFMT